MNQRQGKSEKEIVAHYVKVWTREILDRRWSPRNSCQFTNLKTTWQYEAKANLVKTFSIYT